MLPFRDFFKNRFSAGALLALFSFTLYLPALGYGFLHFDDHLYVTQNPYVASGFTLEGLRWAFFSYGVDNWIPLTWLSHMLDVQVFGMNAGMHHAGNVLLHSLNAWLLFEVLGRMTNRWGWSWFIATIFAIHPAHVESVVWIAERKDVLSTFFILLSMLAYVSGLRKERRIFYTVLTFIFFLLSLFAKPMYVTLPFLLLIFDLWPLERIQTGKQMRLCFFEKIPLFLAALAVGWMALKAHGHSGSMLTLNEMPFLMRISTAVLAGGEYIRHFFLPLDLSVFYPPFELTALHTGVRLGIGLFFLITIFSGIFRQRFPWFFSGWIFFIVTLLPVAGLIKTGDQAMADRYTYFAYIGLSLMLAWFADTLMKRNPKAEKTVILILVFWSLFCMASTIQRISDWKNTQTLFQAATRVHPQNHVAWKVLADDAYAKGDFNSAAQFLSRALDSLAPESESARPQYQMNLAFVYLQLNQPAKAGEIYEALLRMMPLRADLWTGLGDAHMLMGLPAQARLDYEHAMQTASGDRALQERLQKAKAASAQL